MRDAGCDGRLLPASLGNVHRSEAIREARSGLVRQDDGQDRNRRHHEGDRVNLERTWPIGLSSIPSDAALVRIVEAAAGLEPGAISSSHRFPYITRARAAAVMLLRERGRSLSHIARIMHLHVTTVSRLARVYGRHAVVLEIAECARRAAIDAARASRDRTRQRAALAAIIADAERRVYSAQNAVSAARQAFREAMEAMESICDDHECDQQQTALD